MGYCTDVDALQARIAKLESQLRRKAKSSDARPRRSRSDERMRTYLRPDHGLDLRCPWETGQIRTESEWDWVGIL